MSKQKKKIEIDHSIQVVAHFVRAGYNEALYILDNLIIDQEESGEKCITTGMITDFIINDISNKREINVKKTTKEITEK